MRTVTVGVFETKKNGCQSLVIIVISVRLTLITTTIIITTTAITMPITTTTAISMTITTPTTLTITNNNTDIVIKFTIY